LPLFVAAHGAELELVVEIIIIRLYYDFGKFSSKKMKMCVNIRYHLNIIEFENRLDD